MGETRKTNSAHRQDDFAVFKLRLKKLNSDHAELKRFDSWHRVKESCQDKRRLAMGTDGHPES